MVLAAFILFGVAILLGWAAGAPNKPATAWRTASTKLSWTMGCAAAIVLIVAGGFALAGRDETLTLEVMAGLGAAHLTVDALSGLFLVITFGAAAPVLIGGLARQSSYRPRLPAVVAFTLASVAVVILADNLFLLLAGWESLGFAFYLAVGFDRDRPGRARGSVLAAAFSKISGGALLIGGLLLAAQSHSLTLSAFAHHSGPLTDIAYTLLIIGFTVKVGLVPAHIWLPPAYAAAPGPARAILAGSAVNVGFYGLWRTLDVVGPPPVWLACTVLVVAGVSAILGISHAAVHADLRGLIAWSSIENAGIIVAGYGVGLVGAAIGNTQLTAAGLLAGTMQLTAHAVAKSLLFVSASAIEDATGTTDLDRLRGIAKRLPLSGTGLVVGSLTLAGMPLTAGFASEWLTLEALMQQFRVHNLAMQLCLAVCGVLIALTVGVSGIAFVRLIGLTAFGYPPTPIARENAGRKPMTETSWTHRAAILVLAVLCLGLAAFAPLLVAIIARGLTPIVGDAAFGALAGGWILQPVFSDFSALSPSWLWIVIPAYAAVIVLIATMLSGRRFWKVRRAAVWTSGSRGVANSRGYASYGYANPIRKVLAALLLTRHELRREEVATGGTAGAENQGVQGVQLGYVVDVTDVVQRYLYRPLVPAVRAVVATARKLQSGRLDAYMAYMLIALLAVVAVVTALA